jgi:hypothetical protein
VLLAASTLLTFTFLPITHLFLFALGLSLCGGGSGTLLLILLRLEFAGLFLFLLLFCLLRCRMLLRLAGSRAIIEERDVYFRASALLEGEQNNLPLVSSEQAVTSSFCLKPCQ